MEAATTFENSGKMHFWKRWKVHFWELYDDLEARLAHICGHMCTRQTLCVCCKVCVVKCASHTPASHTSAATSAATYVLDRQLASPYVICHIILWHMSHPLMYWTDSWTDCIYRLLLQTITTDYYYRLLRQLDRLHIQTAYMYYEECTFEKCMPAYVYYEKRTFENDCIYVLWKMHFWELYADLEARLADSRGYVALQCEARILKSQRPGSLTI